MDSTAQSAPVASEIINKIVSMGDAFFDSANSP
jgi:hypothetical protein